MVQWAADCEAPLQANGRCNDQMEQNVSPGQLVESLRGNGRTVRLHTPWLVDWIEELREGHRLPSLSMPLPARLKSPAGLSHDMSEYPDDLRDSQIQLLEAGVQASSKQTAAHALVLDNDFFDACVERAMQRLEQQLQGLSRPASASEEAQSAAGQQGDDWSMPVWLWNKDNFANMHQAAIVVQRAFRRWRAARQKRDKDRDAAWAKVKARYMESIGHRRRLKQQRNESAGGSQAQDSPRGSQPGKAGGTQHAQPLVSAAASPPELQAVRQVLGMYNLLQAALCKLQVARSGAPRPGAHQRWQHTAAARLGSSDTGQHGGSGSLEKGREAQGEEEAPLQEEPSEGLLQDAASLLVEAAACTASLTDPEQLRTLLNATVQLGVPLAPVSALQGLNPDLVDTYNHAVAAIRRASSPASANLLWASQLLHRAMQSASTGATFDSADLLDGMPQGLPSGLGAPAVNTEVSGDSTRMPLTRVSFAEADTDLPSPAYSASSRSVASTDGSVHTPTSSSGRRPRSGALTLELLRGRSGVAELRGSANSSFSSRASSGSRRGRLERHLARLHAVPSPSLLSRAASCTSAVKGIEQYSALLSTALQLGLPLPPPPRSKSASRSALRALYRSALSSLRTADEELASLTELLCDHVHGDADSSASGQLPQPGDELVPEGSSSGAPSILGESSTCSVLDQYVVMPLSGAATFRELVNTGARARLRKQLSSKELLEVYCMVMPAVQVEPWEEETIAPKPPLAPKPSVSGRRLQASVAAQANGDSLSGLPTPDATSEQLLCLPQQLLPQLQVTLPASLPVVGWAEVPLEEPQLHTSAADHLAIGSDPSYLRGDERQADSCLKEDLEAEGGSNDAGSLSCPLPSGLPKRHPRTVKTRLIPEGLMLGSVGSRDGEGLDMDESHDYVSSLPQGADREGMESVEHQLQLLANQHLPQAMPGGSRQARRTLLKFLLSASGSVRQRHSVEGLAGRSEQVQPRTLTGIWRWVDKMIKRLELAEAADGASGQDNLAADGSNTSAAVFKRLASVRRHPTLSVQSLSLDEQNDPSRYLDIPEHERWMMRGRSMYLVPRPGTPSGEQQAREAWEQAVQAAGHPGAAPEAPATAAAKEDDRLGFFVSRMKLESLAPVQRVQRYQEWLKQDDRSEPSLTSAAPGSRSAFLAGQSRQYNRTGSLPDQQHSFRADSSMSRALSVPDDAQQQRSSLKVRLQASLSSAKTTVAPQEGLRQQAQTQAQQLFRTTQRIPMPQPPERGSNSAEQVSAVRGSGGGFAVRMVASSSFQMHPRLLSYQRLHLGPRQSATSGPTSSLLGSDAQPTAAPANHDVLRSAAFGKQLPYLAASPPMAAGKVDLKFSRSSSSIKSFKHDVPPLCFIKRTSAPE